MKIKKLVFWLTTAVISFLVIFGLDLQMGRTMSTKPQTDTQPTAKNQAAKQSTNGHKRILIVYFSRQGTNYPDVTLKVGHTARIARYIAKQVKADQFEITPVKAYPKNYQATVDQAEKEQSKNARPAIKTPIPDMSKYDTIFIGYPIWWNELPMLVRTFMDQAHLNGKTIIPFSTNEGSGWGNTLTQLQHQYPRAHLVKGFSVEGEQATGSQKRVERWLNRIGY